MTGKSVKRAKPLKPSADALLMSGLDLFKDGFGIFDQDLILVAQNAPFCALRGYPDDLCQPGVTLEALLRHNAMCGDYGPGDVDEQVATRMREISRFELRLLERDMPDGKILLTRYDPIPEGGLLLTYRDVTDIRQAERALKASEERHALVGEAATEGLYDWDIEHNNLYVSPRLNEMFGFQAGELRSETWYDRVHPDDKKTYRRSLVRLFKQVDDHQKVEYRIRNKSGDYIWVQDNASAVRTDEGRAIRLVGAVIDVTERERMQAALRKSEERYALAVEAFGQGVYDWDITNDTIYYSPGIHTTLRLNK